MTADQRRVAGWLLHLIQREQLELEYPTDDRGRQLWPPPPIDWDQHEHLSALSEQANAFMSKGLTEKQAERAWRSALESIAAERV